MPAATPPAQPGGFTFSASANEYGLSFHHFGLGVADPASAQRFLSVMGYTLEPLVYDPLQNVRLGMAYHPTMPAIEIICPGNGPGPLDKVLATHPEGLVYHLCYVTDDLDATLDALEAEEAFRVHCISDPKPAVLFDMRPVSFYMVTGFGLIEIVEHSQGA